MKIITLLFITLFTWSQAQEMNIHFDKKLVYQVNGKKQVSEFDFFLSENKEFVYVNMQNLIKGNDIAVQTLLNISETADVNVLLNIKNYDAIIALGMDDTMNMIVKNNLQKVMSVYVEDKGMLGLEVNLTKLDKPQKEFFNMKCDWYSLKPKDKDEPLHLCIVPDKSGIVLPLFSLIKIVGLNIVSEIPMPTGIIMEIYHPMRDKTILQIKELKTIDKNFSFKSEFQFK